MTNSYPGRGLGRRLGRRLGLAAAAVLALAAASQQRAEALSLATPGTAPSAKFASDGITTEVRGGHGHGGGGFHGGGGGFRGGGGFHGGGGFRGGGHAFHGGGFRAAPAFRAGPVFRGGGGYYRPAPVFRGGGYHYGYRPAYHRPHFHHRRVYAPRYYSYPVYHGYRHRYCRVIWTYYGPRKICKHRPFYRHHWRPRVYGIPLRYW